jgi:hypothetical protein
MAGRAGGAMRSSGSCVRRAHRASRFGRAAAPAQVRTRASQVLNVPQQRPPRPPRGSLPILYVLSAVVCEATEQYGEQNVFGAPRGASRLARAPAWRARLHSFGSPNNPRLRRAQLSGFGRRL